jgi:hypothetical protein
MEQEVTGEGVNGPRIDGCEGGSMGKGEGNKAFGVDTRRRRHAREHMCKGAMCKGHAGEEMWEGRDS